MSTILLAATQRTIPLGKESAQVRTISTALLLPQDRIPRAPLAAWAERLSRDFEQNLRRLRTVRDLCGAVTSNANNTALVAAHQGAASVARSLCDLQVRWQHRMSRRSGDTAVAARMLQPWVNLARLDGMSGDWQAALARLAPLRSYRSTGRLYLGPLHVHACGWQVLTATRPEFEDSLDCMYVVDSLKVLLLNARFAEALAFASRLGADFRRGLVEFGTEASIVAASRLGDTAEARRIAADAADGARGWERVVFKIRLAEAAACDGDLGHAGDVLAPIVALLDKVAPEKKGELQTLYVLQRLSTLCQEVGLDRQARSVAEDVYRGAKAAGDEVFEIESLRILSATSSGPERRQWEEALSGLEETTLYHRYRRGGREAVRSPLLDRTYEQLGEFLAA